MKKYFCSYFFFLLLLIHNSLEAAPNQEESVLAVTAGCYCDFLNSTATADQHDLYDAKIALEQGAIMRAGAPGNYFYFVTAENKNELVHDVSFENQKRFCNWIENGRASNSTETGAYDLASLEKSTSALCALVDENEGEFFYDPALKINTTTFSITGPAALLGSGSMLSNPKLCLGEEAILPCYEELEYLLGIAFLGAGMEAARGGMSELAPRDLTPTEIDATSDTSDETPQKISASATTDEITNRENNFYDLTSEQARLPLVKQIAEAQQEQQLAQKQNQILLEEFQKTLQERHYSKRRWDDALNKFQSYKNNQTEQEELLQNFNETKKAYKKSEQERDKKSSVRAFYQFGFLYLENSIPLYLFKDDFAKTRWESIQLKQNKIVSEKFDLMEKAFGRYNGKRKHLANLATVPGFITQESDLAKIKSLFQRANQKWKKEKKKCNEAAERIAAAIKKLNFLQEAQTKVATTMPAIQEKLEPLISKLQQEEWSLFVNNIFTTLKNPRTAFSSPEAILTFINAEIESLKTQIDIRDEEKRTLEAALEQIKKETLAQSVDFEPVKERKRRQKNTLAGVSNISAAANSFSDASEKNNTCSSNEELSAVENFNQKMPPEAIKAISTEIKNLSIDHPEATAEAQSSDLTKQVNSPSEKTKKKFSKEKKSSENEQKRDARIEELSAKIQKGITDEEVRTIAFGDFESNPEKKAQLKKIQEECQTQEECNKRSTEFAVETFSAVAQQLRQELAEAKTELARLTFEKELDEEAGNNKSSSNQNNSSSKKPGKKKK